MGFFGGSSVDLTSPGPIGSTTPNTGRFTTLTLAPSANTTPFTASGYSLTGTNAQSLFDLSGTWNTTGTPTAFKLNVTDTASNTSSLLMDLQVGGSSKFSIDKGGAIIVKASTGLSDRSITALGTTSGISFDSANGYVLTANQYSVRFNRGGDTGVTIRSDSAFGITSGNADGTIDTILRRDAADTFAQRRSTNAQTFRLYNTFTDASNYERGFFRWSSNVLEIGAEVAGTGTQRQLRLPLGTVTASTPLSVTQTWNSSGVTFTGIQANITDTASASASLLMDLQVGGTSQFFVSKSGGITLFNNSASVTIGTVAGSQVGILRSGGALNLFLGNSTSVMSYNGSNATLPSSSVFGWNSGALGSGTFDLNLARDASDTLAQRRSTNAQAFKLYRTFTDASNYERLGFLATNTTRYTITSENAGTGSARSLEVSFYTSSADPTSTDITSGCFSVWKNSGTGTIKLWANDGGTMKSVALA